MYKLHIANKNYSSWSLRPWILMKTLQIEFEEVQHLFMGDDNYRCFKAFSPTGRVPVLYDNEIVIWDSLAISEYLSEIHENIWPSNRVARAWARSAAAEMHSSFQALRTQCPMSCGVRVALYDLPSSLKTDINRLDELFQNGLDLFGGTYLTGRDFTAVDAYFCPIAFRVQTYSLPLGIKSQNYINKLLALPAMKEWYNSAISETHRDLAHEQGLELYGKVVSDFRRKAD